jgi:DNA-damage-inducible protein J
MVADAVVRARINRRTKDEAAAVFAAAGLTISDAVRMLLVRTAADQRLPFDPFVPNATTVAAMEASRRGEVETFDSLDALFDDLHDAED